MISGHTVDRVQVTLDHFLPKPLNARVEKFLKLCDFYESRTGNKPDCPYSIYNFIQDNRLPNDIKSLKYVSLRGIAAYYGKWKAINGGIRE